jgi:hypothetical protein
LFYYVNGQGTAADIDTSKGFEAGTPRRVFSGPLTVAASGWDLSPDGKRFLFVSPRWWSTGRRG